MLKKGVLILVCLVFVLAACSTKKETSEPAGTSSSASSSPAATETSEAKTEPVKAYILTKVEAGTELPDDAKVGKYISEQTGVEPIMIKPPAGTYDEKLNLMLASGEPLDAFIVGNWTEFQKKGMIRPINDLLKDAPDLVKSYSQSEWDSVTDQATGNIYAIPFYNDQIGNAPRVRKDWLDALGLEVPTTLEEFENVLEAFKTTDKFGKNVIPLATHLSYSQLDRAFMGLFTKYGDGNWIDTDGSVKPAILDPAYKDYIAKIAEWYAKGYIWKEAFTQEFTVIDDLVMQNRVGVLATWVSVGINGIEQLMTADPKTEYVYLDKFEGPAGSAYSLRLPPPQGVAFSINSKNAEAAIKFFNWSVAAKENRNTIELGLENTHWKFLDKENNVVERTPGADKLYSNIYSLVQGGNGNPMHRKDDTVNGRLWAQYFSFSTDPAVDLKKPADYGAFYDEAKIAGAVPSAGDIDKFRDKWLVKFITGQEPMSKWDSFISDLRNMGLDKMVAERTAQYKAQQK